MSNMGRRKCPTYNGLVAWVGGAAQEISHSSSQGDGYERFDSTDNLSFVNCGSSFVTCHSLFVMGLFPVTKNK